MSNDNLHYLDLVDVARRIKVGAVSPVALTEAMLARIEKLDGGLKSYATTTPELALKQAREAEAEIKRGAYRGPLHGVPIAVKDLCYTKGIPTAAGMAIHKSFRPDHDSTVVERFANGVSLLQDTCPGLVSQIEKGELETAKTRTILENALTPMLENGIDRVVMGCTHYPFVIPLIQEIVGPQVRVIDPAPAVARQVGRVLTDHKMENREHNRGTVRYLTSGKISQLSDLLPLLMGETGCVNPIYWEQNKVICMGQK